MNPTIGSIEIASGPSGAFKRNRCKIPVKNRNNEFCARLCQGRANEKDALSLCEYLDETKKEEDIDCIGITGDDNIHHFPKQNLINGNEND